MVCGHNPCIFKNEKVVTDELVDGLDILFPEIDDFVGLAVEVLFGLVVLVELPEDKAGEILILDSR